ncbi:hypothetical protein AAHN97_06450 [Chitinophaga niabensis]|uniref:hypothetical protein n=1 Tax=Chitinophaga niabensis TaxID=536979 RepID=UPI0031B9CCC8
MTQKEYAAYLGNLIGEEIDTERKFLEEQFYGYFQCFMPYGKDAEKIFEPISNGQLFYERVKPIFKTTEKEALAIFEQNASPGYFVPGKKEDTKLVKEIGERILKNLIAFAEFIEDGNLIKGLKEITEIEISNTDQQDFNNDKHLSLYEAFSDWRIENSDKSELVSVLDEAYYSISCDYFLSAYFQYPRYKNKPEIDFLKPYFELWEQGRRFVLSNSKLILFS